MSLYWQGCDLDNHGLTLGRDNRFSSYPNMCTSSGAHPATFQSCTGDRADHLILVNYSAWRSVLPVYDFNLSYFIKFRDTLTLAGQVGNMRSIGSSFVDKERKMAFLINCILKELGKVLNLSRYQLRMLRGLVTEHCHLKGQLVDSMIGAYRHLKWCIVQQYLFHALNLYSYTNIK